MFSERGEAFFPASAQGIDGSPCSMFVCVTWFPATRRSHRRRQRLGLLVLSLMLLPVHYNRGEHVLGPHAPLDGAILVDVHLRALHLVDQAPQTPHQNIAALSSTARACVHASAGNSTKYNKVDWYRPSEGCRRFLRTKEHTRVRPVRDVVCDPVRK